MRSFLLLLLALVVLATPCVVFGADTVRLSEGWHQGPLPANTYQFGGIVLKGLDPNRGFHFADFRGDHVMVVTSSGDLKRHEANEIGYWNNSITIPVILPRRLALGVSKEETANFHLASVKRIEVVKVVETYKEKATAFSACIRERLGGRLRQTFSVPVQLFRKACGCGC